MDTHLHHNEEHFKGSEKVRDIVIGMSDGLTVPFALAAGLSGAVSDVQIVLAAGIAEIAAGSIAMGLGGFMAGKSAVDHYRNELKREYHEIEHLPEKEEAEIYEIFEEYDITQEESRSVVEALKRNPKKWVDFMMKFELGLEEPNPKQSYISAFTIGISYIVGGTIPLLPYAFTSTVSEGLQYSVIITLIALVFFGYIKGKFTGVPPLQSAIETVSIGSAAAAAAFYLAKSLS